MRRRLTTWTAAVAAMLLTACGGAMSKDAASYASAPYSGGEPGSPPPAPMEPMAGPSDDSVQTVSGMAESISVEETSGEMKLSYDRSEAPPAPPPGGSTGAKPAPAQAPKPTTPTGTDGASGEVVRVQGPMLIYTASLTMAVFEVTLSVAKVEQIARDIGGFLAKRDDNSITIRVPVERFREAVERIEKAGDVLHRNVSVQDVTEEYRDLDIQMKNARAMRDRLAELLQKATKVEESLLIERELGRVAKEVDRLEGRLKFLRDRASFSTITVSFQALRTESISQSPFHLPVPWLGDMGLGRLLSL